jgi:peroxiredoxin
VKIIAEADRGEYEPSLESLKRAVAASVQPRTGAGLKSALLTSEKLAICDAYFQRLVHAGQHEVATKALQFLMEHARSPEILDFASSRLKRLELVGKPAPPIQGSDIDGKKFNLSDLKGKVVLVVFWGSWCLPGGEQIDEFQQMAETYRQRGFEVVGINVDSMQDGGPKAETVLPNVRHFALDHNLRWPTLLSGPGEQDYAGAYAVTEIPANVLIARDGTIARIDQVGQSLEAAIAKLVGP